MRLWPSGFTLFLLLLGALPACLIGLVFAFSLGSVIVRDPDGVVKSVMLRNSGQTVAASQLGSVHFSTAVIEGEAIVRCRNGAEPTFGYITSGVHHWRSVRAADCVRALTSPHRVNFL